MTCVEKAISISIRLRNHFIDKRPLSHQYVICIGLIALSLFLTLYHFSREALKTVDSLICRLEKSPSTVNLQRTTFYNNL